MQGNINSTALYLHTEVWVELIYLKYHDILIYFRQISECHYTELLTRAAFLQRLLHTHLDRVCTTSYVLSKNTEVSHQWS